MPASLTTTPASKARAGAILVLALFCMLALLLSLMPQNAFADEGGATGSEVPNLSLAGDDNALGIRAAAQWGECDLRFESGTLYVGGGAGASNGTRDTAPQVWADTAGGAQNIKKIVFEDGIIMPDGASMSGQFGGLSNLWSIDGLDYLDTSGVSNMASMFRGCSSLSYLDLSSFDTSSVTNAGHMFSGCTKLFSLDLSLFDTAKVTTMKSMFAGCSSLYSLDLSSFDTSKVAKMDSLFENCSFLNVLDLSSFEVGANCSVTDMFKGVSDVRFVATPRRDDAKKVLALIPAALVKSDSWYDVTDRDHPVDLGGTPASVAAGRFYAADACITLTYVAGAGGSVNPDSEIFGLETGVAKGSTAQADDGWRFVNWTNEDGVEVSTEIHFVPVRPVDGLYTRSTYTANFEKVEDPKPLPDPEPTSDSDPTSGSDGGDALSKTGDSIAPATFGLGMLVAGSALLAFVLWHRKNQDDAL